MSLVEGFGAIGAEVADPAFVICLSSVLLLLSLLFAVPAVAAALNLRRVERFMEKLFWQVMTALHWRDSIVSRH